MRKTTRHGSLILTDPLEGLVGRLSACMPPTIGILKSLGRHLQLEREKS